MTIYSRLWGTHKEENNHIFQLTCRNIDGLRREYTKIIVDVLETMNTLTYLT